MALRRGVYNTAGFSPELDRKRLYFKVYALLNTLHDSDLVYVSNGDMGESLIKAVSARCWNEKRFDQYSIALFLLELITDSHATYWAKVSEGVISGKDERARCHCGKLANGSRGAVSFCSDHFGDVI